jgi:hypothetical protein
MAVSPQSAGAENPDYCEILTKSGRGGLGALHCISALATFNISVHTRECWDDPDGLGG